MVMSCGNVAIIRGNSEAFTFLSRHKNPSTIVTTVGTSNAPNNRAYDRSTKGKSFNGGITKAIGSFIVENGTMTHCPPGFGIGTDSNRCDMLRSSGMSDDDPDSRCKCVRNRVN